MTNIYQNIGFMLEHRDMSMEELRLADYDRGWVFGKDATEKKVERCVPWGGI
jgi:hypothetical protein